MDKTPIYQALDDLPTGGVTVRALQVLDFVVPGGWKNVTNFTDMVKDVTGEDDDDYIQEIGDRAVELFNDPNESYQKAMTVFRLVDGMDKVAGAAALASQMGESFSFMSFLGSITPKDERIQAIDAAAKIAAELTAFCLVNGIPGDSVMDFAKSVTHYEQEDAIRFGAWVAIDGIIPLGPNFMDMIINQLDGADQGDLTKSSIFSKITQYLPGGSLLEKKNLVLNTLSQITGSVSEFVASKGLTQDRLVSSMRDFVDISDERLDYLAAGLDMTTHYFEHTGTQTVARRLITRAYGEV